MLFVLLTEDDLSDSKALGEQQSQFASHQRRFVGLSEKEREWSMRSHSSYYGYSPIPTNVAGSPAYVTITAQPSHHQRTVLSKRLFGAHLWSLFLILSMFSSTVHLADTRPHSRTTLVYESSTHTGTITALMLSMAKLIMHRHVRIALFRFPFVNLAHLTSRFLIAFFPDVALNPPSSSPPPRPRRHVFVAGIAVSTSGHHSSSSSKHHPRSIIICPRHMTEPRYSLSTSSTCTTPATRSPQPKSHSPAPLRTLLRL